ncbi:MAG TPA: hypothetical protein VFL70_01175 [Bacteroidia bacterium]|nr:hypothetical protein [Bacteroidia bacterium]
MAPMNHAFSVNLAMTRNGSGTGWLPDSTPMYGYMIHGKKWMYMIHGNVFLRYTKSDLGGVGSRGSEKYDAINWFMGMGQRRIGKNGLFRFSAMMSLDNLFGGNGYPLLFQTGETWQGKPLVDRQHPHDLFSELSVGYTQAINKDLDLFIYAGYPGEPALGSVAFMHRVSSLYGPDAPLSHHWNDGTHITFGVLTAGVRYKKFKLDVSNFTGREPDENRYNFDMPRFDSYSARLSFNPNPYWAFQVSQGFIKSPESTRPDENVYRTTASAVYSKPLNNGKFLNVTGLWGLNQSHASENAALLEAAFVVKRFSVFGRYEYVEKSLDELGLDETKFEHHALFGINALSIGLSYDMISSKSLRMAIGAQGTYYSADSRLNYLYGHNPLSGQIFLRIYPPRMFPKM